MRLLSYFALVDEAAKPCNITFGPLAHLVY
jgi:hypothetical protein